MSETRNIKVVKTDGSVIQVRVNSFDVARSLALVSPLTEPVILIHQGHCLYPYMSIASQNVSDGDVVVLKSVKSPPSPKSKISDICSKSSPNRYNNLSPTKQLRKQAHSRAEETTNHQSLNNYRVFEEALRISDLQFKAYESSISGGFAYQQMAETLNHCQSEENLKLNVPKTKLTKSDSSIPSDIPLPVFWSTEDEEINNQNQTQVEKIPDLPGPPQIVPSSSID